MGDVPQHQKPIDIKSIDSYRFYHMPSATFFLLLFSFVVLTAATILSVALGVSSAAMPSLILVVLCAVAIALVAVVETVKAWLLRGEARQFIHTFNASDLNNPVIQRMALLFKDPSWKIADIKKVFQHLVKHQVVQAGPEAVSEEEQKKIAQIMVCEAREHQLLFPFAPAFVGMASSLVTMLLFILLPTSGVISLSIASISIPFYVFAPPLIGIVGVYVLSQLAYKGFRYYMDHRTPTIEEIARYNDPADAVDPDKRPPVDSAAELKKRPAGPYGQGKLAPTNSKRVERPATGPYGGPLGAVPPYGAPYGDGAPPKLDPRSPEFVETDAAYAAHVAQNEYGGNTGGGSQTTATSLSEPPF